MFDTSPHRILARFMLAISLATPIITAAPEQAHAVIIDGVAARINAEIITLYDVRIAATPFMLQRGMDPSVLQDPARRSKIYRQVLDDLIERKLLLQEAGKLGLSITDEEVEQWIAFTRQQQGLSEEQFKATIAQYGMNYTDYRAMMRQNLLRLRVTQFKVGAKVSISDAEVEARYRERASAAYAAYLDYLIGSGPILQLILRERHQDSPLGAESQRQFRRLLRRVAEDTRRALSLAPREAFVLLELTAGIPEALARLVRGGEIDRETAHATCRRLVTASVDGVAVAPTT